MEISIQQNKARLKVKGKSWDDVATDSGGGKTIDQITLEELEQYGFDLPDIDDDTHILIGYDDGTWLYIEDMEPIDLGDFDLDNLNLDWEIETLLPYDDELLTVDDNFNIVQEELPDHIEIVTLPIKLSYLDGEEIIVFGMRVVPKRADNSTWTNSKYFRGYIPLQELIIDPANADVSQTSGNEYTDDDGVNVGLYFTGDVPVSISGWGMFFVGDHIGEAISGQYAGLGINLGEAQRSGGSHHVYLTMYNSRLYYMLIDGSVAYLNRIFMNGSTPVINGSLTTAYVNEWNNTLDPDYEYSVPVSTKDPHNMGELHPTSGKQTISVIWPRYGDGKELVAEFEIEVEESPGGGGR